jgi:hypothetical protein
MFGIALKAVQFIALLPCHAFQLFINGFQVGISIDLRLAPAE